MIYQFAIHNNKGTVQRYIQLYYLLLTKDLQQLLCFTITTSYKYYSIMYKSLQLIVTIAKYESKNMSA